MCMGSACAWGAWGHVHGVRPCFTEFSLADADLAKAIAICRRGQRLAFLGGRSQRRLRRRSGTDAKDLEQQSAQIDKTHALAQDGHDAVYDAGVTTAENLYDQMADLHKGSFRSRVTAAINDYVGVEYSATVTATGHILSAQ